MRQNDFKIEDLPSAFLDRMKLELGNEYDDFLASYSKPYKNALRLNSRKANAESLQDFIDVFSLTPVPWCPSGYYYNEETHPGKSPYHDAGLYYIQEPSAMAVAEEADIKPGEYILDLCAAPGGKSTAIADKLDGKGLLISNEIHPGRAKILSQNIERMGISNAIVLNETPDKLAEHFPLFFDRVLVDAPCSGEGMFRKEPAAIECWSQDNIDLCAARQKDILNYAKDMLRAGGVLVYSTCTFATEEDEKCIEDFLSKNPDFTLEKTSRLWPHKIDGEGHFIAVLRKGTVGEMSSINHADNHKIINFGNNIYLCPADIDLKGLKCLRPGLQLGFLEKGRFVPSHALALALNDNCGLDCINLNLEQAAKYISGEGFIYDKSLLSTDKAADDYSRTLLSKVLASCPELQSAIDSGWRLVLVNGYTLGWCKISGNQIKNHYPKGLRHY